MDNSILIINGNNSPVADETLINYFKKIFDKKVFFLNKVAKPKNFNNSESLIRIFVDKSEFRFENCSMVFIIESLTARENKSVNDVFSETELLINAIKTRNSKIKIFLIATDFGYARQDRALNKQETIDSLQYETAEPEALKLKLANLQNAGLSTLIVFDPHSLAFQKNCEELGLNLTTKTHKDFLSFLGKIFFRMFESDDRKIQLFFEIFSGLGNIEQKIQSFFKIFSNQDDHKDFEFISDYDILNIINFFNNRLTLVSPDSGSKEKIKILAQTIRKFLFDLISLLKGSEIATNLNPKLQIVTITKIRTAPGQSTIAEIEGNAQDKICLIVDDILDTGGTLCNAAEALKKDHGAKAIHCFITHGVLSKNAVERLNNSCLETINLTNSVTSVLKKTQGHPKFEIHDLFDLICQTVIELSKET